MAKRFAMTNRLFTNVDPCHPGRSEGSYGGPPI